MLSGYSREKLADAESDDPEFHHPNLTNSVLVWRIPGTGSLVGCRLLGHTELDMTKVV